MDNIVKSEDDEKIKLTKSEEAIKKKLLDLGAKFVVKNKLKFTIYKNHFFENEKIIHIECGDSINIAMNGVLMFMNELTTFAEKGTVFVWGLGPKGELGLGPDITSVDIPTPIKDLEGKKIVRVVAGYWHFMALSGEGIFLSRIQTYGDRKFREQRFTITESGIIW